MKSNKSSLIEQQKDGAIEKAVSQFSQHLMSDSKWVRLINTLVENADYVKKIQFKKVQNDRIGQLHLDKDSTFEFDYWQTGFEGNNSFNDWLEYKELEYLVFPKKNQF